MLGYVKKDKLLDEIRATIDFCRTMTEKYEVLIEALHRDNASPMTIQSHEKFRAEWAIRYHQSTCILSMLERA